MARAQGRMKQHGAEHEGPRPVETKSSVDLQGIAEYAAQRLALAAAYPREDLVKREFRLPFLDVTGLFSDSSMAQVSENGLTTRHMRDEAVQREIEIHVMSSADGKWPAPAAWRESSFSPVAFDRVITGHHLRGYYHHEHRFWQFFDPGTGRGVQSMLAPDRYPPWESCGPLRAFLHWSYDAMGMRLAHAAALGMEGRGVLLAGSGGSGKSGTTLAGITHGMQSAGDDYVLLDRGPTRQAHAVFSKMKQDVPGLRRAGLRPSQLGGGKVNWQNKIEFDPTDIHRDALAERMEIVAIMLPTIAHRPRTTIEPARPAEAMLALAPSGLFQMPGCAASGVRFFSKLVRELPAYHLFLSEDPAEITDTINRFLNKEGLARAS